MARNKNQKNTRRNNTTADAKQQQQAFNVVRTLKHRGEIKSMGTERNYITALKPFAAYVNSKGTPLTKATKEDAVAFLTDRATTVSNSTLNTFRQAANKMLVMTKAMPAGESLPMSITSEREDILESRAYSAEQANRIMSLQSDKNALSTEIAFACGLRAHELYTLRRREEAKPDKRKVSPLKWSGIKGEGVLYVVKGKGGLNREILMPKALSDKLEQTRLPKPGYVKDRNIAYRPYYAIGGGKNWSSSFSKASIRGLGWSNGAHGARHSYAQRRMQELQYRYDYNDSLEAVSQEMGHFRPDITLVYLR